MTVAGALPPEPLSDSTVGVFGESLKSKEAVAAPLVCGVKITVKDLLCPGCSVKGNVSPLAAYSGLFTLAAVTVTLAPLAVRVAL